MPSLPSIPLAPIKPRATAGGGLVANQAIATIAPPDAAYGDAAMYKLSKRLWTIEIHRRLEMQTRRAL